MKLFNLCLLLMLLAFLNGEVLFDVTAGEKRLKQFLATYIELERDALKMGSGGWGRSPVAVAVGAHMAFITAYRARYQEVVRQELRNAGLIY